MATAKLQAVPTLPATQLRLRVPKVSAAISCWVRAAVPPTVVLRAPLPKIGAIRTLSLGWTGVREPAPSPPLHLRLITGVGEEEAEAAEEGPGRARRGADLYEV